LSETKVTIETVPYIRFSDTFLDEGVIIIMPIIKVNRKYQVTIPASIRKKYHIQEGDFVEAVDTKEGILLKPWAILGERTLYQETVIKLFQEGQITVSRGAELLNIPIQDFMDLLHNKGLTLWDETPEEIEEGLQTLQKVLEGSTIGTKAEP
jgi:AbrB family looped-hinge helix DNA binding protein